MIRISSNFPSQLQAFSAFCRNIGLSSGITQRYKKIVDFDQIRKKHVTHFNFTVLFGGGTSNENEYSSIIDGILDNKLKRNPSIIMLDYVVSISLALRIVRGKTRFFDEPDPRTKK